MNLEQLISQAFLPLMAGGVGVAVINAMFGRRKSVAEAESIEAETATKLLRGVTEEIGRLQERIRQLEERVEAAERRADQERREKELVVGQLGGLRTAYAACLDRIAYLTGMVRAAGLDVSEWTPPKGMDLR